MRTFHAVIRFTHLGASALSLPLAVVYLRKFYPSLPGAFPGLFLFLVAGGGIFWGIFSIIYAQRYFPDTLPGAGLSLFLLLVNGTAAASLGRFDPLYGSFSVIAGSILGQSVYMAVMLIMFVAPGKRARYYYYTDTGYAVLPASAFILLASLMAFFAQPVLDEIASEPERYLQAVYCLGLLAHATRDAAAYLKGNLFQADSDGLKEKRDLALARYALPVTLVMIASIVAAMVAAMVDPRQ